MEKQRPAPENPGKTVLARFEMRDYIGGGSFGDVFAAFDRRTCHLVAIKTESKGVRQPKLKTEYEVFTMLRGTRGFPQVFGFTSARKHNLFAMTLLGKNLQELLKACGGKFSARTTLMLGDQLLERLQQLHDLTGHLHRDIKPENMMMGRNTEDSNLLHLVDLGLAKAFMDNGVHYSRTNRKGGLTGSARYCSVTGHRGGEQSRRDDLESAGYVLVYFAKGRLPWQGLKASNKKQRNDIIGEIKLRTHSKELCHGLPKAFRQYMNYVKVLGFDERPDYSLLRQLFIEELDHHGWSREKPFDWVCLEKS